MKKFKNFTDLNIQVNLEKSQRLAAALQKMQTGVFIENLKDLNDAQLEEFMINKNTEHLEYALLNRDKIVFDKICTERTSWETSGVIYTLPIENSTVKIEFKVPFTLENRPLADCILVHINERFLQPKFIKKSTVNYYTSDDYNVIELYKQLFDEKIEPNQIIEHKLRKTTVLKIEENIEYMVYYEFLTRRRISAGLSKQLMLMSNTRKTNSDFPTKVKNHISAEYTLPILGKNVDELSDDDIIVFKMHQI